MKPDRSILQDIRVLDFSWVLAGPYATRLLADFGAEVIKVHPLAEEANDKFSQGYYNTWNRNKRSITLDVNQPAGLEIARKLIAICDIVVENFNPRVMMNWGLDYPELKKLKPDIILLSMS
ncbi:MAG TPA: CoA transferase, partial [Dehalococcoidales bacterium]